MISLSLLANWELNFSESTSKLEKNRFISLCLLANWEVNFSESTRKLGKIRLIFLRLLENWDFFSINLRGGYIFWNSPVQALGIFCRNDKLV